MRRITVLLLLVISAATTSFGGGYQVGLHSTRNIGMGLIGTSLTYDASSLFYNPGGASMLSDRFSFSGGISFLMARTTYQGANVQYQEHINHEMNYPLYFYANFKLIDDLSIGVAVNTPYGLSMAWPEDWKGRFLIQDVAFKAITIQPTLSWKYKDIFGFGAGLVIATGDVDLNKAVPLQDATGEGSTHISGSTTQLGFNVGLMLKPVKNLNIGISYRSKIDMTVDDGEAIFDVPASLATNFPANEVNVTLPLPANLDFGVSYEINEKFMIGLSLNYVFWNVYDSLVFNFKEKTPAVGRTSQPKLYENRLIPRLGVQWQLNKLLTIRAGGYFDPSPVPSDYLDPMLPSADEIGLTCGVSIYPFKGFSIDAAFEYLMGLEREGTYTPENFSGTYSSVFYIPCIGLTYNF